MTGADRGASSDAGALISSLRRTGGACGALIAGRDWSLSPLGPLWGWPQSLRTALGLLLASPVPMVLLWGEDGVMLYNDAYSAFAGGRHPELLGSKVREGWPEVAAFNDNVMRVGLSGGTLAYKDQELTLFRHGRPEQVFMNLDYSPVPGDDGAPAGVLAVVVETTAQVAAQRRQSFLVTLSDQLRDLSEPERVAAVATEALGRHLGVGRAGFGEVDSSGEVVTISRDWSDGTMPALAGEAKLLDPFGPEAIAEIRAGRTLVIEDCRTDPRTSDPAFVANWESVGTRGLISVPLVGVGRLVAMLYVHSSEPRAWSAPDISVAEDTAARTWSAVRRARAEVALRDSEDHYRQSVELNPQIAWTATPDGLLDQVAPRWEAMTGTSGLGMGWGKAIHPEDRAGSAEGWARAISSGEPYDIEHRIRLRDGSFHWMHSRAFPRRDALGRIEKWYGTTEDIHPRKAAEEALRAAEAAQRAQAEELRAVLDAVPAGIWITHDAEAREIRGNARSYQLLRMPEGRNQSKGVPGAPTEHFCLLDADGTELARRDYPVQTAARGIPVVDREYRVAFSDGSHLDILGNGTPLRDADGAPAGAVAAFVDITARKEAEAALREESRHLETLNRAGAALAAELDPERLLQVLTDAGVELSGARFGAFFHNVLEEGHGHFHLYTLSGATRADFAGMGGVRATGVFAPTFANEGVVRSDDILQDPRYGRMEPHRGMPGGHLPVRSYLGVPVVSRSGAVLGGLLFGHPEPGRFNDRHERLLLGLAAQAAVAIDNARLFQDVQRANETLEARVTERTGQLLAAQEALQQSQKMEAIGQLTGGIAHDFNNLLTPIVGGLDIIRRRVTDERSLRLVAGALQSAERATVLVQRLLAFARRQTLLPRAVRLSDLVDGMRELIDRSLGPTIEVGIDVPADLPPVLVDPNQLELALLNLSVNARDAMPGGGRLTIAAEAEDGGSVPGLSPGSYIRLSVTDTGTGMDEVTLRRAIEPFFSTKGTGKGTGLGLSMVHGLALQSGGLFALRSEPGRGTVGVLWLPVAGEAAEAVLPVEAAAPKAPRPSTVLLVDDEALVRQSTAEGLRELGYEVVELGSAPEALEALQAGLAPDALVTDHLMPGMTGAQLAAELRAGRPGLPVLVITGYANLAPEQLRGLEVLAKPFRQAELATRLARMLDS